MQIISIPSSTSYSNLQSITGYAVGTAFLLTNNTSNPLFIVQSATEPTASVYQYPVLSGQTVVLEANTNPYWIKGHTGPVLVQLPSSSISPYSVVDLPDDVYTAGGQGYRRLQVDQEQASFQNNEQFRLFDRYVSVPNTSQIVYYFETTNPLFVLFRKLDLYQGGREYLVYPTTGVTFTGTLGSPLPLANVNGHLRLDRLVHPTSGVTVRKAVGAGIFNAGSVLPPNGTVCLTDGNANRASATYAPNDQKSGVAAGQSFYLVLEHIGSNNATSGQFSLMWEELFPS